MFQLIETFDTWIFLNSNSTYEPFYVNNTVDDLQELVNVWDDFLILYIYSNLKHTFFPLKSNFVRLALDCEVNSQYCKTRSIILEGIIYLSLCLVRTFHLVFRLRGMTPLDVCINRSFKITIRLDNNTLFTCRNTKLSQIARN